MHRQIAVLSVVVGALCFGSAGFAGPQVLEVSPRYLEFTGYEGGADPAAQVVSIWNSGHGPMDWTVTPDCNWITVEPNSGASSGEVDDANVIVDINGLVEGTYNCQLTVTGSGAPNSPQIVDVNLIVIGPILELSGTYFEFTAFEGGANPADQILSISNIGGGTLNWEITEDCDWLSAEPTSGSSTGEVDDANFSVDITGLAEGSYDCNLIISDPNAANSPQIVDVHLDIYEPNFVSWWKFDEGGGTTAYDSAGDNDGTIYGATWTTGQIDGALDFDGVNDYVSAGDPADGSLDFGTGNFSISAWVKQSDLGTFGGVFSKTSVTNGLGYGLHIEDGNRFYFRTGIAGWYKTAVTSNTSISTDTWYHVVGVREDTTVKIYVNGSLDNSTTGALRDVDNTVSAVIGRFYGDFDGHYHNGTIDDVRIYDRALSAEEILQLCGEGLAGRAFNPNPGDGATGVELDVILSWSPGAYVASHDVYFGTGFADVNDATTSSAAYMGNQDTNSWDSNNYAPSGLETGQIYYWRIDEVNDFDGNSPWKGNVWSFETGTRLIGLSATQFDFTVYEGGTNPADQILSVSNIGIGTLNWEITEACSWLTAAPDTGSSTGEVDDVNLSVDITELAWGTYNCQLTVSDSNASNSPQIVDVNLVVIGSLIGLSATQLEFTAYEGGANPDDQILSISNIGGGTLNWEITEASGWLTVAPDSGSSTGEVDDVNLSVDITGLAGGTYNCQLTVADPNAENNPQVVDVNLVVIGPIIELSAMEFEFSAVEGGANPNDQTLSISNIGGGTLNWTVTADCNWLTAEPNSGSSTGEADDVNLSVDISGIGGGIYDCNVTVTDPNSENNPQVVGVSLFVGDSDGVLYVPGEYATIQSAIDVALDGDEVIVASGTYTGSGNKNLDFGGKAITVQSINPDDPCVVAATVIDCENSGRGFYFHSGEGPNSVVSGLTIKRGRIGGSNAYGAGIYCSGSSPTIENCIITDNKVHGSSGSGDPVWDPYGKSSAGGGIFCTSNSNPMIINCTISNNIATGGTGLAGCGSPMSCNPSYDGYPGGGAAGAGIYCTSSSNPTIEDCTIANNTALGGHGGGSDGYTSGGSGGPAQGGGIFCAGGQTLNSCTVINNTATGGDSGETGGFMPDGAGRGGGICGAAITVSNCTIRGNQASLGSSGGIIIASSGGGGIWCTGTSSIINCLIAENNIDGDDGTGIAVVGNGSHGLIKGCSIVNNTPGNLYSVGCDFLFEGSATATIIDSIIWGHNGYDVSSGCSATYSCVEQDVSGEGNIAEDPCFVTGPEGDYYLSQITAGQAVDSPCVDAGSDTAVALGMDVYTTRSDEVVDVDVVDMGYHYPITISADVYEDWHVDFFDYGILASDWFECDSNGLAGDITRDTCVDGDDLGYFVECWLDCYVTAASAATPANGQDNADPNGILVWSAGDGALEHDVYFGTDANAVGDANYLSDEFMGTVADANFDPGGLDFNSTYYWRIDEVGPRCMTEGGVWSFTTWGLVSRWKFDEGSGTTAYDSAGDNDGTIYGAVWTSGQIDGALSFDGVNDYVNCGSDSSLDITDAITIGAWVKRPNFDNGVIAGKTNGNSVTAGYGLFSYPDGLEFSFYSGGWRRTTPRVTIPTNEWHHVAGTFDGNNAYLYVDGEPSASLAYSGTIAAATGYPFYISFWRLDIPNYFNGTIDDVRIYDRVLSAEEIQQLYQDGL